MVIKDIKVVADTYWEVPCPSGYRKLLPNTNRGNDSPYYPFVCVLDGVEEGVSVTDVTVIYDADPASLFCPVGYEKLDGDLNIGAGGDYIYICQKKESGVPPVADLVVKAYSDGSYIEDPDAGFTRINVDLNRNAKGFWVFLDKKLTDWPTYCNAMIDIGIGEDNCVRKAMDNIGSYDYFMRGYCQLPEYSNSDVCACINSAVNKMTSYNPLCLDENCIKHGYITKSMEISRGEGCEIVDCSTYLDIKAAGTVVMDDVGISQRCGNNSNGTNGTNGTTNNQTGGNDTTKYVVGAVVIGVIGIIAAILIYKLTR